MPTINRRGKTIGQSTNWEPYWLPVSLSSSAQLSSTLSSLLSQSSLLYPIINKNLWLLWDLGYIFKYIMIPSVEIWKMRKKTILSQIYSRRTFCFALNPWILVRIYLEFTWFREVFLRREAAVWRPQSWSRTRICSYTVLGAGTRNHSSSHALCSLHVWHCNLIDPSIFWTVTSTIRWIAFGLGMA
jgi:hypothetical protein